MRILNDFIKARDQKDRFIDIENYNRFAEELVSLKDSELSKMIGIESIDILLRYVYEVYYSKLKEILKSENLTVLEIGAGYGRHTGVLLGSSVKVLILDISKKSLAVNMKLNPNISSALLASINSIPLEDSSIDLVVSCESLSYADPNETDREIFRILKPGGNLVVLDSLNHNPIYILNRLLKAIRGTRTFNSIFRIPTIKRINRISARFENTEVIYFGKWIWISALLRSVFPISWILHTNQIFDRIGTKKLAFKFILISKDFQG